MPNLDSRFLVKFAYDISKFKNLEKWHLLSEFLSLKYKFLFSKKLLYSAEKAAGAFVFIALFFIFV